MFVQMTRCQKLLISAMILYAEINSQLVMRISKWKVMAFEMTNMMSAPHFLKFGSTERHNLGTLNFPWSVGTRMEGPVDKLYGPRHGPRLFKIVCLSLLIIFMRLVMMVDCWFYELCCLLDITIVVTFNTIQVIVSDRHKYRVHSDRNWYYQYCTNNSRVMV